MDVTHTLRKSHDRPLASLLLTMIDRWHHPTGLHRVWAAAILLVLLAGGGLFVYMTGGTQFAYVHILYIPIILAAFIFRIPGGFTAGLLAGLIVGPIMPLDVGAGAPQPLSGWLYRLSFFVLVGGVTGVLAHIVYLRLVSIERLVERVSTAYSQTLKTHAKLTELRDEQTAGHCERVATNAYVVGEALGLDHEDLVALYWAGLLHDVGKIAVPERILLKPGALTEEEYEVIQTHTTYGADIINSISLDFQSIARGIRTHHERWDGSGYPHGLAEDDIPLFGRILGIVDVFEALTSDRPYREAWPPEKALAYIEERRNQAFDPHLTDVFVRLYHGDRISVSDNVLTPPGPTLNSDILKRIGVPPVSGEAGTQGLAASPGRP